MAMGSSGNRGRGGLAGVVLLSAVWVGAAVWYYLPYMQAPDGFPKLDFTPRDAAPKTVPETVPDPVVVPTTGKSIDSFMTRVAGYNVIRSDFGISVPLYNRRDFGAAQAKAEELYKHRNEGRQGSAYNAFINALGRLDHEENVDSMISTLKSWQKNYPDSHFPLMIEAVLRMNLADAIRAGKWSTTIGRAAMLGYDTNYRQAKLLLEEAQAKQPEDAVPAIDLIRASEALNMPTEQVDGYFDYAHARSPQNYAMWRLRLQVLSPRWGRQWEDMRELMQRAEEQAKTNPQVEMVVVDGLVQMHRRGMTGIDLTSPEQWRQVAEIYDRVLTVFPEDQEILSLYAHRAAEFCPDAEETAQLFDRIGDTYYDGGIWDSLAQYNQARTHAYVRYARVADTPESSARIEKAYELSPDDWYVAYHYGLSCAKNNELKEALDALQRAVNTNPSFVPAINATAHVYLHLKDYEHAEVYANRAVVRQPLGKLLHEAEQLLADARAKSHSDAGGPVVSHSQ